MTDTELIKRFLKKIEKEHLTLQEAAEKVGRSKNWASYIVNGKITTLRFQTRGLIREYLGDEN